MVYPKHIMLVALCILSVQPFLSDAQTGFVHSSRLFPSSSSSPSSLTSSYVVQHYYRQSQKSTPPSSSLSMSSLPYGTINDFVQSTLPAASTNTQPALNTFDSGVATDTILAAASKTTEDINAGLTDFVRNLDTMLGNPTLSGGPPDAVVAATKVVRVQNVDWSLGMNGEGVDGLERVGGAGRALEDIGAGIPSLVKSINTEEIGESVTNYARALDAISKDIGAGIPSLVKSINTEEIGESVTNFVRSLDAMSIPDEVLLAITGIASLMLFGFMFGLVQGREETKEVANAINEAEPLMVELPVEMKEEEVVKVEMKEEKVVKMEMEQVELKEAESLGVEKKEKKEETKEWSGYHFVKSDAVPSTVVASTATTLDLDSISDFNSFPSTTLPHLHPTTTPPNDGVEKLRSTIDALENVRTLRRSTETDLHKLSDEIKNLKAVASDEKDLRVRTAADLAQAESKLLQTTDILLSTETELTAASEAIVAMEIRYESERKTVKRLTSELVRVRGERQVTRDALFLSQQEVLDREREVFEKERDMEDLREDSESMRRMMRRMGGLAKRRVWRVVKFLRYRKRVD